jgi:large subunit ribosomal protein L24
MTKNLISNLKVGDTIKIIAGNEKGLIGNITSVMSKQSLVVVEGVVPRIKYIKNKQGGEAKQLELAVPIHISNVMLWDKVAQVTSRIGHKMVDNKKVRYFKKSGNIIS